QASATSTRTTSTATPDVTATATSQVIPCTVGQKPASTLVNEDYPLYPPIRPARYPQLYGISMVSADEGWAVGGMYSGLLIGANGIAPARQGFILHYSGGKWTPVSSPTSHALEAIQMISPDEGWAVGDNVTILHYAQGHWSLVQPRLTNPANSRNDRLMSLSMASAKEGWAVGDLGITLHYTGGRWVEENQISVPNLYAVSMVSAKDGWAGGLGFGARAALFHYQSGVWEDATFQMDQSTTQAHHVGSISMVSATQGWAVAGGNIWQYCQGKWLPQATGPGNYSYGPAITVSMVSATEGWAFSSELWHYNAGQWAGVKIPRPVLGTPKPGFSFPFTGSGLQALSMISPTEGWAIGNELTDLGTTSQGVLEQQGAGYFILHYQNGAWTLAATDLGQ
ncbi:MAG TPA: hypothetical protein VH590_01560, partial [Ktedonobacterales bacterium]